MTSHPDDRDLTQERDSSRAREAEATQLAVVADADGNTRLAAALRVDAARCARAAADAERQLRINQQRRRTALAHTVAHHPSAASTDRSYDR